MTARRSGRSGASVAAILATTLVAAACSSGPGRDPSASNTSTSQGATSAPVDDGPATTATSADGGLRLATVSTRASLVSGGDVLVTVTGDHAHDEDLALTVDGEDETDTLTPVRGGQQALVTRLAAGETDLEVDAGDQHAALTVTNHPINGPVFAGPHLEPWACTTESAGLGPPTDDDCAAPTRTTWSYVDRAGAVVALDDLSGTPPDAATVRVRGHDVPFVIRAETSVIDRGIAHIWVLDPHPTSNGTWDDGGWNHRLVYRFGGGCGTQYSQGSDLGVGLDTDLLSRGYALATNTLDTFQTACNSTLSAEAALMTREHFVEAYGRPRFTIGDGASGGAIQQLTIATAYPGLLDALSPSAPFPDAISISPGVADCGLLLQYYDTAPGQRLTDAQRAAIEGHLTTGTCRAWARLFLGGINPTDGCSLPPDQVYDPATNPDGARCTLQDSNVAVLGRDPDTGFARRPLSNAGVQYGLAALDAGTLTPDEFLDLNEGVGGYDIDGQVVAERETMDDDVAALMYEKGGVTGQGPDSPLLDVPIILRAPYTDAVGDIHTRVQPFAIRDRLQVDGHDDPNLALWTSAGGAGGAISALVGAITSNEPIFLLDRWLTASAAHDRAHPDDDRPLADRLADARPAHVDNRCTLDDGTTLHGGWELYDEPGRCADAFPVAGDPRIAAGGPQRGDIIDCTLVPVDPSSYDVDLTPAQVRRLQSIFPNGVCDWTQPGIGQGTPLQTWPSY